jgi:HTH-type transcriptional regulator/antitoxin HigA
MAQARDTGSIAEYRSEAISPQFMREVARMSVLEDGPGEAREFLAQHGIGLEFVNHLHRTHLDGAALRLITGRPVIGLTLRYDRIDCFWFTLLHELGHVGLHLGDCSGETGFVDDHSLRGVKSGGNDTTEQEADQLAQDALIPPEIWDYGTILENPGPMAVLQMAWEAQVHPAIVAGRVRYETGNYRLLSQFVGTGEVRRQFGCD